MQNGTNYLEDTRGCFAFTHFIRKIFANIVLIARVPSNPNFMSVLSTMNLKSNLTLFFDLFSLLDIQNS